MTTIVLESSTVLDHLSAQPYPPESSTVRPPAEYNIVSYYISILKDVLYSKPGSNLLGLTVAV